MPDVSVADQEANRTGVGVTMMFHPTHYVPDLSVAEDFFQRVFGRSSTNISAVMKDSKPGDSNDYSIFTHIRDVYFDSVNPALLTVGGKQRYAPIEEAHLGRITWYAEGRDEIYRNLQKRGIGVLDRAMQPAEGDEAPAANMYLVADDAGIMYSIMLHGIFPIDPRTQPDWVLPPVSDDDPLGIDYCAYHTVLTSRPERAAVLFDVLGGTVIHEGRDEARGTAATYVHLADGIIQVAVPDEGTPAHDDLARTEPHDTYHALTWKVVDLGRTRRHLEEQGVRLQYQSDDLIITDPSTSLGIPWGFTTQVLPGDPRS